MFEKSWGGPFLVLVLDTPNATHVLDASNGFGSFVTKE